MSFERQQVSLLGKHKRNYYHIGILSWDMQKGILFAPLIIFIGVMVAAGCTGTGSTDATTQATPTSRIVHLPATVIPNATSPAANTSITTPSFNVKPTTTIDTSVYFAAADDPFMNKITFNVISWTISDCYMQEIFPDIVNNPNYGINASGTRILPQSLPDNLMRSGVNGVRWQTRIILQPINVIMCQ